jgi:hypothetical protein
MKRLIRALINRLKAINDFRFSGKTNWKQIVLHSIFGFALFATTFFLLFRFCNLAYQVNLYLIIFLPWIVMVVYLLVAYWISKGKK